MVAYTISASIDQHLTLQNYYLLQASKAYQFVDFFVYWVWYEHWVNLTQKRHLYEDYFIFYMHACHAFKVFNSFWRGIAFKLVMQLQKTSVFKAMKGCQYYMCLLIEGTSSPYEHHNLDLLLMTLTSDLEIWYFKVKNQTCTLLSAM